MIAQLPRRPGLPPAKLAMAALFITTALLLWSSLSRTTINRFQDFKFKATGPASSLLDAKNETLGFSRIFILALPERTDKKDSILMGASLSGLKFDWVDGVKGDQMPDKALPKGWMKEWGGATLGCWRGHLDIAHKMIKEGIQSALIMEDDADWDVMIKEQFYQLAKGAQAVQNVQEAPYSPYGDDWDLLWVGHCAAWNRLDEDHRYYVIPDDPTVPPAGRVGGAAPNRTPPALGGNRTRLIFDSDGGRCTSGYALSLRGAYRVVFIQSLTVAHSIDRGLSRMCTTRRGDFKCISPYPTLIGSFKDAGDISKDSDRINVQGQVRKVPETRDIVYSVRLNVDRLLDKQKTFKPQWPEDELPELSADAGLPEGHVEWITKDQFV